VPQKLKRGDLADFLKKKRAKEERTIFGNMVMHGQNSFGKLTKKGYPENYAKKGDPETPIDRSEGEVILKLKLGNQ
jgi:preprotein translocase subunit Sec63